MSRPIDNSTWQRLSPHLDDLLDLPAAERAAHLAALRAQDPAEGARMADELAALLQRMGDMAQQSFLETPALPPPTGLAGQAVGAYTLVREIGRGGMGSVWLAQRSDGRYQGQVAIKFMQAALLRPGDIERFVREGQLLARLDHPHIARLLDAGVGPSHGQHAGQPYLVLDYVDGQPIDAHCQQRQLDTPARVRLMLQVLAAVAHAHSRLILHRDLKPSNILVTADGQPKLLDFGIGKLLADAEAPTPASTAPSATPANPHDELTRRAGLAFTTRYAAPEQLLAQEVTTATDVYTLGVLLYGLLGGGHPTELPGAPPVEQMRAVTEHEPRRLSDAVLRQGGAHTDPSAKAQAQAQAKAQAALLRGDLDSIVARALKKKPAERYANAAALADDLRRWLDHEPVVARPDRAGYRASRFVRRHLAAVVAAGSAGAVALMAGAGVALWQARQAQAERVQAEALVEFMLGDLKDKLNQLGRVDLLQSVGEKALAYHAQLNTDTLDDDSLARHARAQRLVAETARLRLDNVQAQRGFEQAAHTTALLLQRSPQQVQRLQEHAASLMKLDEMAVVRSDTEAALNLSRDVSRLLHRAADLAPEQPELRLKALASDHGVAYALTRDGQPLPALQVLEAARKAALLLPPDLPQLLREQADNRLTASLALTALGRHGDAATAARHCVALMDRLPELTTDAWLRRVQRMATRVLIRALLNQGELQAAEQTAQRLVAASWGEGGLLELDPSLEHDNTRDRLILAEALWARGQLDAAQTQWARAAAQTARRDNVHTDHADWHLGLKGELLALQRRLQQTPPTPESAQGQALQRLLTKAQQFEARGRTLHGRPLLSALQAGLTMGEAQQHAGNAAVARSHWQTVVQRAHPAAQAGFAPAAQQLAQALLRLGDNTAARGWLERLQASDYRHPDLAALQHQLAAAEAQAAHMPVQAQAGVQHRGQP